MDCPKHCHLLAATKIPWYLQGTLKYGILFPKVFEQQKEAVLLGYSYVDCCGDKIDRRSTSGYLFKFLNPPISWSSKKQPSIALSTCE